MHLYTNYRKWQRKHWLLKKSLKEVGIQSQRRPKKKWLAELLANKYAVGLFLEFLKETAVGSREGVIGKAVEWARKRDQERGDQLRDF